MMTVPHEAEDAWRRVRFWHKADLV